MPPKARKKEEPKGATGKVAQNLKREVKKKDAKKEKTPMVKEEKEKRGREPTFGAGSESSGSRKSPQESAPVEREVANAGVVLAPLPMYRQLKEAPKPQPLMLLEPKMQGIFEEPVFDRSPGSSRIKQERGAKKNEDSKAPAAEPSSYLSCMDAAGIAKQAAAALLNDPCSDLHAMRAGMKEVLLHAVSSMSEAPQMPPKRRGGSECLEIASLLEAGLSPCSESMSRLKDGWSIFRTMQGSVNVADVKEEAEPKAKAKAAVQTMQDAELVEEPVE